MRKLLLSMFLLCASYIHAQEKLSFSEVIPVDSVNKTQIYAMVRGWVATTYNSAQDVIQMDDKDAGIIICSALFEYSYGKLRYAAYEGAIDYTLKIQIKDGRFKGELSNFIHKIGIDHATAMNKNCNLGLITTAEQYTDKGAYKTFHNNVWSDIKSKAEIYSEGIFELLKKVSKENVVQDNKDDDW